MVTRAPLHMPRGLRLGKPWLSPHGNSSNTHDDTGKPGRKVLLQDGRLHPSWGASPQEGMVSGGAVINLPKSSVQ